MKKIFLAISILLIIVLSSYLIFFSKNYPLNILSSALSVGDSVDSFNGIIVYNNGMDYSKSHGKHYNNDSSFYYGKKWQCVEFIKRYYHDHLHFTMPDGMGNAKDFYKGGLGNGMLNEQRGLLQFQNESTTPPAVNDILVFGGKFGHVAIVTDVSETEVQVIQQNIFLNPRESFPLRYKDGIYTVGKKKKPNGWLRLPK